MKLRLTESDLRNLISSTVNKILKENIENNELLGRIVERLSNMDIQANVGSNDIEVPLDEEGNVIAFIEYEIDDNRYAVPGQRSLDRDVPDDPYSVEGDFDVHVNSIVIYDENDNETEIMDNGMVAKALKDIAQVDESNLEFDYGEKEWEPDNYYGY